MIDLITTACLLDGWKRLYWLWLNSVVHIRDVAKGKTCLLCQFAAWHFTVNEWGKSGEVRLFNLTCLYISNFRGLAVEFLLFYPSLFIFVLYNHSQVNCLNRITISNLGKYSIQYRNPGNECFKWNYICVSSIQII